jgi:hypothetical protein
MVRKPNRGPRRPRQSRADPGRACGDRTSERSDVGGRRLRDDGQARSLRGSGGQDGACEGEAPRSAGSEHGRGSDPGLRCGTHAGRAGGRGRCQRRRSTRAGRSDPQDVALEADLDGPIAVGPVRAPGDGFEPRDRRRGRMAVRVAEPGRHDRDLRVDRLQERLGARGLRAMVGDLEELNPWQSPGEELGIDVLFDIARQQEAVAPERPEQDDRDVVDGRAAIGRTKRHSTGIGPQNGE